MIKNKDIGYILHKAAMSVKNDFTNKLNEYGITPGQLTVLKEIYYYQKKTAELGLAPASIAAGLECDRPTISGILDRLEAQEWTVRLLNPNDKRSFLISVTDKAIEKIKELEEISLKNRSLITNGFSEEEIRDFKNYLLRVVDNFK